MVLIWSEKKDKMSEITERAQEIFKLRIPGQQTQREKILWMQQNRMNGTWVKCFQCQKWRYLKNIFDPVDVPDKWQCSMNLDKFNSCDQPQSQFNDSGVVRLKFTAGSLVWVNSSRYSRWPGMVDDDPELAQFYWLDSHDQERKACMYHVVFIDVDYKNTSRQWFSENELVAFTWYNSQMCPGKLPRLLESVRIAREALDMNVFQRLQKFSFARLYRGHIFSFGHAMRSLVVSEGQELEYESDCTLLSCSDTEDEEYYESLRGGYPSGCNSRKKRGVITPYEYFERSKNEELTSKPNFHSKKNSRNGRASSVGPSENDLERRERASSVGPNENTRQRKTSLDNGPPRRTTIPPQPKTPQKRERAISVTPKENHSQRQYSLVPSKDNKKRSSAGSTKSKDIKRDSLLYDNDFDSRNRRSSSVAPDNDSKSRNRRASSVVARDNDSKSRNRRSSSVAQDNDSKSRNRRASSVLPDNDSKSRYKRSSSVARDNDSNSRNRRASSVLPDDSKSRYKRSSSVARDNDSKSRNRRASSVVRDNDSKSRNSRGSSVAQDINSKSRNKRDSSISRDKDPEKKPMRRRASSVAPDSFFESEARNKTSHSMVHDDDYEPRNSSKKRSCSWPDHSDNNRVKRKAALSAPDDYFKSEGSNRKSRSTSRKDNPDKSSSRKSLDSSGDYFNSRSRRASSVAPNYAENRRGTKTSSNTSSYNFEPPSRSRMDSSRFTSESFDSKDLNYNSNSRSRKDSSKINKDFSENRRERRAASVAPFSYSETNQRRKRASSVAPVKRRESNAKSRRPSLIAPVDFNYCDSTQENRTTTPTASFAKSRFHNQETPKFNASEASNVSDDSFVSSTSSINVGRHSVSRETKKRTSMSSNPSRRLLRSQTRSSEDNAEENSNYNTNVAASDYRNMNNSLLIPNTPPLSNSTPIHNRLPSNIPRFGHGLIRRTVFEVTRRRWKFIGPNGEYYCQDLVTESHNARPF